MDSGHYGGMRRPSGCAGNEHHAGLPGDGLYQCCGGGHGVRAGGHRSKPGIQAGKESVILWADVAEQAVWFREQNLNMAEEV